MLKNHELVPALVQAFGIVYVKGTIQPSSLLLVPGGRGFAFEGNVGVHEGATGSQRKQERGRREASLKEQKSMTGRKTRRQPLSFLLGPSGGRNCFWRFVEQLME